MKGTNIFRGTNSPRLSATVLGSEGVLDSFANEAVVFFDDNSPILFVEKEEMWTALHVIKHIWYEQPLAEPLLDEITKLRGADLPAFLDKLWALLERHPNDLVGEVEAHG